MAQNATLTLVPNVWTLITDSDVTAVRVQNYSTTFPLMLQATSGTTAPTNNDGIVNLAPGQGIAASASLGVYWPGVTTPKRVWAKSSTAAQVLVSHA